MKRNAAESKTAISDDQTEDRRKTMRRTNFALDAADMIPHLCASWSDSYLVLARCRYRRHGSTSIEALALYK